jgi:hypothetical protein
MDGSVRNAGPTSGVARLVVGYVSSYRHDNEP